MPNIIIGKIGKTIWFNEENWGASGGDNEAPQLYENLFHRNPSTTFYILGRSDYSRLHPSHRQRLNKHGNVIDIWADYKAWASVTKWDDLEREMYYPFEYFRDRKISVDGGIIFAGPNATTNIVGLATKMKTPDELASPLLMMRKYSAPVLYFLNEVKPPYVLIVNDPRYFPPQARDWMHMPKIVLSQYDTLSTVKIRKSYSDNEIHTVEVQQEYSGVETIFLIGRDGTSPKRMESNSLVEFFGASDDSDERNIKFMVVCNEGRPSRFNLLKEAILNDVKDVEVYGQWDPKTIGSDPRFKGSLKFNDLQKMLKKVKYTYCIPIKKGWVTAKFWEMTHNGIVPFIHPSYDEQDHLKIPSFLRVGDSKELFKRIEFLEKNPAAYEKLMGTLKGMLRPELYSGEFLSKIIMSKLDEAMSSAK